MKINDSGFSKWQGYWQEGDTGWKHPEADKHFFETYQVIREQYLKEDEHCLVPLCGDSPAVRFLYDQGHRVTAIDMVPEAVTSLKQHSFGDVSFDEEDQISRAERICIHQQNFFDVTLESGVDFVYDRAALIALDAPTRVLYVQKIISMLSPAAVIYVESIQGDDRLKEGGPPFAVDAKEVDTLYQDLKLQDRRVSRVQKLTPGMLKRGVQSVEKVVSIYQRLP